MYKKQSQLTGIADEIRYVFASCLLYDEAVTMREAGKPLTPEEIKQRMMNRIKKDIVEMINRSREPGQERVNPSRLLQQIEQHIDTQRWPFKRQNN